jgi:hypothetical protein
VVSAAGALSDASAEFIAIAPQSAKHIPAEDRPDWGRKKDDAGENGAEIVSEPPSVCRGRGGCRA